MKKHSGKQRAWSRILLVGTAGLLLSSCAYLPQTGTVLDQETLEALQEAQAEQEAEDEQALSEAKILQRQLINTLNIDVATTNNGEIVYDLDLDDAAELIAQIVADNPELYPLDMSPDTLQQNLFGSQTSIYPYIYDGTLTPTQVAARVLPVLQKLQNELGTSIFQHEIASISVVHASSAKTSVWLVVVKTRTKTIAGTET